MIYGKLLYDTNLITINTEENTIKFKNIITQVVKIYHMEDFDGRFFTNQPIKGGWVRNFYLTKDKKVVKKISNFIYSNQKEIEESFNQVKDLGSIKYSLFKSLKILFRYPIINDLKENKD